MARYVLGHDLKGEGKRLALMSELFDPMHRRYIQRSTSLNQMRGHWKSAVATAQFPHGWQAQIAPGGQAVAVDLVRGVKRPPGACCDLR